MFSKLSRLWPKALAVLLLLVVAAPFITRARGGDEYAQLPMSGNNFEAYSDALHILGRCYLLSPVTEAVIKAYEELEETCPEQQFIYAEMGWKGGGRFDPHRTHREGLSADFITPMKFEADGSAARLPIGPANRWGYDLRLDREGCLEDICIDISAVILHIQALDRAAREQGYRIKQVIFDPPILLLLRNHQEYNKIQHIRFMEGQAWFPHDGHYHVDFEKLT